MSNEVAQPTEQNLSRPTGVEGTKGNKPPALDTSACTFLILLNLQLHDAPSMGVQV